MLTDSLTTAAFPLLPHEAVRHRDARHRAFQACWDGLSAQMQVLQNTLQSVRCMHMISLSSMRLMLRLYFKSGALEG